MGSDDRNQSELLLRLLIRQIRDTDLKYQKEFDNIEKKLDSLLRFKWQIVGGAAVSSAVIGTLVSFGIAFLSN